MNAHRHCQPAGRGADQLGDFLGHAAAVGVAKHDQAGPGFAAAA